MANEEQLARLKQGVDVWNAWREKNPGVDIHLSRADLHHDATLSGANLSGADLRGADLSWADLSGADFTGAALHHDAKLTGANLRGAHFREANLSGTDLRGTDLRGAHLNEAELTRADLSGAHLTRADLTRACLAGADLSGAHLSEADLTEAQFYETTLGNTELTNARGLDSCHHFGPSTIDHRTVMQSWPLPLAFLRGCGLPDTLIESLRSPVNEPLQFYSCFISYSSNDRPFADRLYADLWSNKVRCWFAPHDIQGGKKTHEQIDQAIRVYDKLLLILSEASINSDWVEFEIRRARKREVNEKRRVLFPIRLIDYDALEQWECFDADTKKDLAVEIREYFIPDFTTWKDHHTYQKAFDRLLQNLKAEAQKEQKST